MRKAVAHAYSNNSLLAFEPHIDAVTATLVEKLDEKVNIGSNVIDLAQWLHWYAFDVVGELALGKNFGLVESQSDHTGILSILKQSLQRTTIIGQLTGLAPWLNSSAATKILNCFTGVSSTAFRTWVNMQVRARMQQDDSRKDMLAMFKEAKDAKTGQQLDIPRVLNESFTVMCARSTATRQFQLTSHRQRSRKRYHLNLVTCIFLLHVASAGMSEKATRRDRRCSQQCSAEVCGRFMFEDERLILFHEVSLSRMLNHRSWPTSKRA